MPARDVVPIRDQVGHVISVEDEEARAGCDAETSGCEHLEVLRGEHWDFDHKGATA